MDPGATGGAADDADEAAEAADRAARPLTRTGRPARAAAPPRLSPARAAAGAAVSVAGVLLGIGTLLWISTDPSAEPGPAVQQPVAQDLGTVPEHEEEPVDPAPAPAPSPSAAPPSPAAPSVPSPAPPPPPPAPAAAPAAPSLVVPVTVLNNSRISGLADRSAARFRAQGWPVRETGNAGGRFRTTTVYYEPGQEASAREFARRFGVPRVLPRLAELRGSGLTVVVTRDFA